MSSESHYCEYDFGGSDFDDDWPVRQRDGQLGVEEGSLAATENIIEKFDSGATRNASADKYDYEGFLSPVVLEAYGKYMHEHRFQKDGSVRASDNWQEGIPFDNYMKSLVRHVFELWHFHRTGEQLINKDTNQPFTVDELCCAIMFNSMGYLKEYLVPAEINA